MSVVSKITESELEILKVLWSEGGELSLAQIRTMMDCSRDWDSSTIKTLIRRLCDKGVLSPIKREVFYYKALVSEAEYHEYATQSLIDRLYEGSAKNLVASLLGRKKLARKEIEELRMMFKVGDDHE